MTTAVVREASIDLQSADGRRLLLVLAHVQRRRRLHTWAAGAREASGSVGLLEHSAVALPDHEELSRSGVASVAERARQRHAVYAEQVRSFSELISMTLPAGSTIAVISRGDDALGAGLEAFRHFPSDGTGRWIGHHPSDSNDAIRYLREAIERGATHVGVPEPSRWWLDHYSDFALRLACGPLVADVEGVGAIWALPPMSNGELSGSDQATNLASPAPDAKTAYDESIRALRCWADAVLGAHRRVIVISRGDPDLVGTRYHHFPVNDHGIYDGHPSDDADALDRLRAARERGAEYVLIPEAMAWWAETYPTFWAIVRSGCTIERPGSGWLCDLARTDLSIPTSALDEEST